jgi:preprotein translocase subunit SecE
VNALLQELIHVGIYKRSQGRITRQLTWVGIAAMVVLGLWELHLTLQMAEWQWVRNWNRFGFQFWLPGILLVAGLWIAFRIVNLPAFADFLIAVEAEMNKVSWPSRAELFRASMVVLFTIFFLAIVLYGFDLFWAWFFRLVNVSPASQGAEAAATGLGLDWRALLNVTFRIS